MLYHCLYFSIIGIVLQPGISQSAGRHGLEAHRTTVENGRASRIRPDINQEASLSTSNTRRSQGPGRVLPRRIFARANEEPYNEYTPHVSTSRGEARLLSGAYQSERNVERNHRTTNNGQDETAQGNANGRNYDNIHGTAHRGAFSSSASADRQSVPVSYGNLQQTAQRRTHGMNHGNIQRTTYKRAFSSSALADRQPVAVNNGNVQRTAQRRAHGRNHRNIHRTTHRRASSGLALADREPVAVNNGNLRRTTRGRVNGRNHRNIHRTTYRRTGSSLGLADRQPTHERAHRRTQGITHRTSHRRAFSSSALAGRQPVAVDSVRPIGRTYRYPFGRALIEYETQPQSDEPSRDPAPTYVHNGDTNSTGDRTHSPRGSLELIHRHEQLRPQRDQGHLPSGQTPQPSQQPRYGQRLQGVQQGHLITAWTEYVPDSQGTDTHNSQSLPSQRQLHSPQRTVSVRSQNDSSLNTHRYAYQTVGSGGQPHVTRTATVGSSSGLPTSGGRHSIPRHSIPRQSIPRQSIPRRSNLPHVTHQRGTSFAVQHQPVRAQVGARGRTIYGFQTCPDTGVDLRIDGMDCRQAVIFHGDQLCYTHEYSSRLCCQMCRPRKRLNSVGCEYGDRSPQCSTIRAADCYDLQNRQICCDTCERLRIRDAAPGCEYGDISVQCENVRYETGLCYIPENLRVCCGTCASHRNNSNPGCPWGDYSETACDLFDNNNKIRINCYNAERRRTCCQSCERLKEWVPDDIPGDCEYGDRPVVFNTDRFGQLDCSNIFNYFRVDECTTNPAVSVNCCYTCHRHLRDRG